MTPRTQTSRQNKKRPKKKVKRRIHKGRLALVLTVLALIIVGIMSLLSRCSSDAGTVFRAGGDFRKPIPEAIDAGHRDAKAVIGTEAGTMERDNAMLKIKARETRLRQAGYNHAADDYINSARDLLLKNGVIE